MTNSHELKNLKDLLNFDAENEDIYSVEGRMRALLDYFKSNKEFEFLQDFLKVYYLVTEKVVDSRLAKTELFKDSKNLNKLDAVFCSLYFNAVNDYIFNGSPKEPWVNTFKLSTLNNYPFVNVLMGINSHINGDLAVALNQINFKNEQDFDKVSSILYAVIPSVMGYLAFERMDLFGAVGLIARQFVENEFNVLIVKWRDDSYDNYLKLKKSKNIKKDISYIKKSTELLSENIYNVFKSEIFNPVNLINDLNKMEVRL